MEINKIINNKYSKKKDVLINERKKINMDPMLLNLMWKVAFLLLFSFLFGSLKGKTVVFWCIYCLKWIKKSLCYDLSQRDVHSAACVVGKMVPIEGSQSG